MTNRLEVDCLQIEHELHRHQPATELQVSPAQGECTNTPTQQVLIPPHLGKSRVKFKLCFPIVVLSREVVGSMYKQSGMDKDLQQYLMGYQGL